MKDECQLPIGSLVMLSRPLYNLIGITIEEERIANYERHYPFSPRKVNVYWIKDETVRYVFTDDLDVLNNEQ